MYLKKLLINRPLTPHLTIYSNQITSNYSIWHRITGIVLIGILLTYITFLKMSFFLFCLKIINLNLLLSLKNIVTINIIIIFTYHVLSGLKHIKWDLNYGIYLNQIFNFYLLMFWTLLYVFIILILKIFL